MVVLIVKTILTPNIKLILSFKVFKKAAAVVNAAEAVF